MKMIKSAIGGTLIGIGGGGVLALSLNSLLPSVHAAPGDQAVFVGTLMYGRGRLRRNHGSAAWWDTRTGTHSIRGVGDSAPGRVDRGLTGSGAEDLVQEHRPHLLAWDNVRSEALGQVAECDRLRITQVRNVSRRDEKTELMRALIIG